MPRVINTKQRETVLKIIAGDVSLVSEDFIEFNRCTDITVSLSQNQAVVTMTLMDETDFPFEAQWFINRNGRVVDFHCD